MDEDPTWYGSRPRPRPHCVIRGPTKTVPKEYVISSTLMVKKVVAGELIGKVYVRYDQDGVERWLFDHQVTDDAVGKRSAQSIRVLNATVTRISL